MKKAVVLFAFLAALSSSAFAEGYVGAGLGQASVDIDASPIGGVQPNVDDSDTAIKLFAGYKFHPQIAAEIGYMDLGEYGVTWDDGVDYIKVGIDASAIYAAVVGFLPINDQVSFMGKAGFARWDTDYRESSSLFASFNSSDSGTEPMFGVGIMFSAANNLALRAEFERLLDVGDENTSGTSDVDVISASAVVKF